MKIVTYNLRGDFGIDYIFTKVAARCTAADKWQDQEDGVYLSDHYPVCTAIHLC